jgi:hypothetical protein
MHRTLTRILAVALLLWSLPAGAERTSTDDRSGRSLLGRISSKWGARSLGGSTVPELDYRRFGYLTDRGVQNIQRFVQGLQPGADKLVLFRGQKQLRPRVSRMPEDRARWPQIVEREVQRTGDANGRQIDNLRRYESVARGCNVSWNFDRQLRYYCEAQPLDHLVFDHQSTYGNRLLVPATRGLSVAAGDYNMRTSDNRNRYIYVLVAPKDRLVNVHALDKSRGEFTMRPQILQANGNPRIKEKEIAVWLDATDCVAGIYDAVQDRFLPRAGPLP